MKEIKVTVRDLVELLPTKTQVVVFSGDTVVYSGDALSIKLSKSFMIQKFIWLKYLTKRNSGLYYN